ncbi:uncharacterized protein LOC135375632 [Ornithodoros turicata]|uniref:uncharacterized protein LOC135375632 n=1 Tax=Ornithodoros turicata TaxID=34597 RepID=UPI003139A5B5
MALWGYFICSHPVHPNGGAVKVDQYYVSKAGGPRGIRQSVPRKMLPEDAVTDVVLKVVKLCDNLWEFCIMAELAARLTASELPSVTRSVACAYVGAFYKNGSVLVMPYCQYGTLLDLVNVFKHRGESVPECLVLYFTLEMLMVLAKIHSVQIIHGDVKPDNILIVDL